MDKQTAKRVEVVPCWFDEKFGKKLLAKKRFHIEIDGFELIEKDKRFCGTEAEARAKAAELRAIDEFVVDPELAAAPQVATSAETRPPDTYELLTREILTIRHAISKAIPLLSQLAPARAAAPVEPPCDHKILDEEGICKFCGDTEETWDEEAAREILEREPVEQAPRPQVFDCNEKGCIRHYNYGELHSITHYSPCLAASSPAARPRVKAHCMVCRQFKEVPSEVVNVCDDCAKKMNSTIVQSAEPAARVAQPTPCQHQPDKRACSICAPAAPVVAQRELRNSDIVKLRENMANQIRSLLKCSAEHYGRGEYELGHAADEKARFLWMFMPNMNSSEFNADFAAITKAQNNWRASQRTEGEGQHGK